MQKEWRPLPLKSTCPRQAQGGAVLLLAAMLLTAAPVEAQSAGFSFFDRYQGQVATTQGEQPHWITPLVTVTPRLEQEVRADFVHQYNREGIGQWNYGNGKGLELIPARHTEIIINVPPFLNRSNGA